MTTETGSIALDLIDPGLPGIRLLRAYRQEIGLSQDAFANRMGVSRRRVRYLEGQDINTTPVGTLKRYVEALGGQLTITATFGSNKEQS